MELREMRSFALLATCGSLQEVAERTQLSPAAVHQHLKSIESRLGIRLYRRTPGRLLLTEPAKLMLPYVRECLAQHESALAALEDWRGAKKGTIRVGAGPSFCSYLLPALLKQFRRRAPGVEVFVESGTSAHLHEHLQSGSLDLIFDVNESAEPGESVIAGRWLSQAGFVGAASNVPPTLKLRDIQKRPFILFQRGTPMEAAVQAYFNRLGFEPSVVMRSDSAEAIKAMVRAGLGLSVLNLWNVSNDLRSKSLVSVRTDAPPLEVSMALLRQRSGYVPSALAEFVRVSLRVKWRYLTPIPLNDGA